MIAPKLSNVFKFTPIYFLTFIFSLPISAEIEIKSVQIGIDNYYKRDNWTQIRIDVKSRNEIFDGKMVIETRDLFSETILQTYSKSLQIFRNEQRKIDLTVFIPRTSIKFQIRIIDENTITEKEIIPEIPKQHGDLIVIVVAPERDLLRQWDRKIIEPQNNSAIFVGYATPKDLPDRVVDYSAIDVITLRNISITDRNFNTSQQLALLDWIFSGGTLILSGGRDFRSLRDCFLTPFFPIDLNSLKNGSWIDLSIRGNIDFSLRENSEILFGDPDQIEVARRFLGSGQIINFAFDYADPNFRSRSRKILDEIFRGHAKTPKRDEEKYDPFRRHHEMINRLLIDDGASSRPLIRQLFWILIFYSIAIGVSVRFRRAWMQIIGVPIGLLIILIAMIYSQPQTIRMKSFSILTRFPDRDHAYFQSYFGLVANSNSNSTIDTNAEIFVRQLTNSDQQLLKLNETGKIKIEDLTLDPWQVQTFFAEGFIDLRSHSEFEITDKFDPNDLKNLVKFSGDRQRFLEILGGQSVLRYLQREDRVGQIGWTDRPILQFKTDLKLQIESEMLIIDYAD